MKNFLSNDADLLDYYFFLIWPNGNGYGYSNIVMLCWSGQDSHSGKHAILMDIIFFFFLVALTSSMGQSRLPE